jgi:hypothetical protein
MLLPWCLAALCLPPAEPTCPLTPPCQQTPPLLVFWGGGTTHHAMLRCHRTHQSSTGGSCFCLTTTATATATAVLTASALLKMQPNYALLSHRCSCTAMSPKLFALVRCPPAAAVPPTCCVLTVCVCAVCCVLSGPPMPTQPAFASWEAAAEQQSGHCHAPARQAGAASFMTYAHLLPQQHLRGV